MTWCEECRRYTSGSCRLFHPVPVLGTLVVSEAVEARFRKIESQNERLAAGVVLATEEAGKVAGRVTELEGIVAAQAREP